MAAPQIEHAFALMTRGDAAQAANVLARLLRDAPAYAPGHVLYAQACEALHRWPDALSAWQTVSLLMPDLDMARAGVLRSTRVIAMLRSMTPASPEPAPAPAKPTMRSEPFTSRPATPEQSAPSAIPPPAPAQAASAASAPIAPLRPIRLGDYASLPDEPLTSQTPPSPASQPAAPDTDDLPPPPPELGEASKPFASRLADAFRTQSFETDNHAEPTAPSLPTDLPPPAPTPPSGWGRLAGDDEPAPPPPAREPSIPTDLDLDDLIADLNSAGRMRPRPDLDSIPPPRLDDDIDDMVSPTMGRIFAAQGNAEEAARVFERLAEQQPDRAAAIRGEAARLFDRQAAEQPEAADAFRAQSARLRAMGYE